MVADCDESDFLIHTQQELGSRDQYPRKPGRDVQVMIIQIRLYEELNRILNPKKKKRPFWESMPQGTSLGQLIASLGLDKEEVDLGLVNSKPAGFRQVLRDRDRVSLYPEFESFDIRDLAFQESGPLRRARFVAPPELSLLVERLRQMGYDCRVLSGDSGSSERIEACRDEKRVLLIRDRDRALCRSLDRCLCLRSRRAADQVGEVLEGLQLDRER